MEAKRKLEEQKQRQEKQMNHTITTGAMSKSVTAYDKDFDLTIDGVEMRVILHWDDVDGFETTWLDKEGRFITSPDWLDEVEDFCLKLDGTEPHSKVSL
jgi:hypothetical protein